MTSPRGFSSSVQVVVRLRPMNEKEQKHGTLPVVTASTQEKTVTVIKGQGSRQMRSCFTFDNVFTAFSSQEEVFEATLKPVIGDVMHGYESTVFAYGQTGTGKTHTMEGELSTPEQHGVIPRSALAIFEALKKPEYNSPSVTCSYLEIYNEDLCDLLVDEVQRYGEKKSTKLEIMEGKHGTFCRGLTEKEVQSAEDVLMLMQKAQQQRKIGETKMNKQSSRSHCIFTIRINAKKTLKDGNTLEFNGKLHMVDLAGSECAKTASLNKASGAEAARERERMNINRSLLTLGRVISMLKEQNESKKGNSLRIPYRDSKLTRILQESLGGRCKTLIVATLSPSITAIEESISTLNYAQSANGIVNKPVATSFLSVTPNGVPNSLSSSGDGRSSESGNTVEHWHEMECKLTYMQAQVEEAQAALARKHMQQQELVERADQAENEKLEMEKQYFEASQKVNSLTESLAHEKEQNQALGLRLKQTEITLKRTSAILEATQRTEDNLVSEATLLIETLKASIKDGDELHKRLIEAKEDDIQRRKATKNFQSSSSVLLEMILSRLQELHEKEEKFLTKIIDIADNGHDKDKKSLAKSLELTKEIKDNVSNLNAVVRSQVMEKEGFLPLLSLISREACDGVKETKETIEQEELRLTKCFLTVREDLEQFSKQVLRLDSTYTTTSEEALAVLEQNVSDSQNRICDMINNASKSLTSIKCAREETRASLEKLHLLWKEYFVTSATNIQKSVKHQSTNISKSLEKFSAGQEYHDSMDVALSGQKSFISKMRESYDKEALAQKAMLSKQKAAFLEAQQQQQNMQNDFLKNVMLGVETLIKSQMEYIEKEQKAQFGCFESSNENIVESNGKMSSTTKAFFNNVEETNKEMVGHVQVVRRNDSQIQEILEVAKEEFVKLDQISKNQQESASQFASKANLGMDQLLIQDTSTTEIIQDTEEFKRDCIKHLNDSVLEKSRSGLLQLAKSGKEITKFANDNIISKTTSNLINMERPREDYIADVASRLLHVGSIVQGGNVELENKARKQCSTVEEVCGLVVSRCDGYTNSDAKHRSEEIESQRELIVSNTKVHGNDLTSALLSSVSETATVKTNIDDFATNVIRADDHVPLVAARNELKYSEKLSSTPSEETIVQSLDLQCTDLSTYETKRGQFNEDVVSNTERLSQSSENSDNSSVKSDVSSNGQPFLHGPSPLRERQLNRENSEGSSAIKSFGSGASVTGNVPFKKTKRSNSARRPTKNKVTSATPTSRKKRVASTPTRISGTSKKPRSRA